MSPGTISSTARAVREHFHAKATTPETVAQASQLFSAAEAPFTRKTRCFVEILTFQSHPWFVKTNLSCETSFEFQKLMWKRSFRSRLPSNFTSWRGENDAVVRGVLQIQLYSTLLNSSPLYSTQLNSTLLCSTLLNSSLPNSSQLYSPANWT